MKKLALLALIGSAIYMFAPPTQDATAAVSSQDRAKLAVPEQLISNSGWEAGKISWESTGSATFTIDSSTPLYGKKSALWDSSATGEYLRSKSAAVLPAGMKGQTCLLEARYTWSGVAGEVQLQALDQTNAVLASVDLQPSADPRSAQLNFTCPDPGSTQVKWALASTADSVAVKVDAAFIGTGKNAINISQSYSVGSISWPDNNSCAWQATGAFANFVDDADCDDLPRVLTGELTDSSAGLRPEFTIPNAKAGKYIVTLEGQMGVLGVGISSTVQAGLRLHDGTSVLGQSQAYRDTGAVFANITGSLDGSNTFSFELSSPQALTVNVQGSGISGNGSFVLSAVNGGVRMSVYYFPSSSAEGITLETSGFYAQGFIQTTAGDPILGGSIPTLSPVTSTTLELTTSPKSSAPMRISCLSADSIGTDCGGNTETVGFSVDVPYAGDYQVCFNFGHYVNEGATGSFGEVNAVWDIIETSNTDHTITLSNIGPSISSGGGTSNAAATTTQGLYPVRACGVARLSSAGKKTFHIMRTQTYVGVVSTHLMLSTPGGNRKITMSMRAITQQMPTPVFTDLTDSLNAKPENYGGVKNQTVVYGSLGCGPSSTINRNPGSWMVSVGGGTGICQITFAPGVFNNTPWCFCQTQTTAGVDTGCNTVAATVTNTFHDFRVTNSAAALTSGNINVVCIGD